MFNSSVTKCDGITHLELYAHFDQPYLYFEELLQSFPNLESLEISGFEVQSDQFSMICKYMPKLKVLVLQNGFTPNEVRVFFYGFHMQYDD